MGQSLPNLLGDEGHEGMQQLHGAGQDVTQHLLGADGGFLILAGETGLAQLDKPVAEVVPDEGVQLVGSNAQLVLVDFLGDFLDQSVVLAQDPLVLQIQLLGQCEVSTSRFIIRKREAFQILLQKLRLASTRSV